MSKILAVGWAEFLVAVRSKAFLLGVLFLPIIWGAAILVPKLLEDKVDTADRPFAVVDHTGELYEVIAAEAAERDERLVYREAEDGTRKKVRPRFVPERLAPEDDGESWQLALSDRVRSGELFGFFEIGRDVVVGRNGDESKISYFTETPTYDDLPDWLRSVVNGQVRQARIAAVGLDEDQVDHLTSRVPLDTFGLASVSKDTGEVLEAEEQDESQIFVAFGGMMLIFLLVMTVAPAGLNNVLEEKMQKISEVLVAAVSPFQLMAGKLLGTVFVALTLSVLYVGTVVVVLSYHDLQGMVPASMFLWFALFLVMALLIFGALFSAIGAACSEMRDAQSFMMPAMMMVMFPMFVLQKVIEEPNGTISTVVSLFPPATPFLMLARIGLPPGPPAWQVALSVVLTGLFCVFAVWAGGKIFRVGLLSQGQAPTFAKLTRWVFSK